MRWIKPSLRNSIYGLLGHGSPPTASVLDSGMEDIREAMLDLLEDGSLHHPQLTRRIRYATDIQSLWYLRGDLMAALADDLGEARARVQVRTVSCMFKGLLPSSIPVPAR